MSQTPIIDSHVHLWDQRGTPREGSPLVKLLGWHRGTLHWAARRLFPGAALDFYGKPDHVLADYLAADYQADVQGRELRGFVHVDAGWVGKGPLGPVDETRWLEGLSVPALKGIVGLADLSLGDAVEEVLGAHLAASPRFRGIRQLLFHHPDKGILNGAARAAMTREDAWRRGFACLAKNGLSFETVIYDHQLVELAELANDFPEVPVILCHLGMPVGFGGPYATQGRTADERASIAGRWHDGMARLAQQPNVSLKLSGVASPCFGWGYHLGAPPTAERVAADLGPVLNFAIDTFGADRCMFGSNFPVDKVGLAWTTIHDGFELVVADRSDSERRAIFHDSARRVYRLGLEPEGQPWPATSDVEELGA